MTPVEMLTRARDALRADSSLTPWYALARVVPWPEHCRAGEYLDRATRMLEAERGPVRTWSDDEEMALAIELATRAEVKR